MKPTLRVLLAGPLMMPVCAWGQQATNLDSGFSDASIQTVLDFALAGETIELSAGTYTESVVVDRDVTIQGDGLVTWTASSGTRIIELSANVEFTLDGVTISSSASNRQAIAGTASGNTIVLRDSTFDTSSTGNGGALIATDPVSITVSNTLFQGEATLDGGAIHVTSGAAVPVTLTDVTFDGVSASSDGGAIFVRGVDLSCTRCTFNGTEANASGGAIYADDGTVTVTDSLFCGTSATVGGAIYGDSDTTLVSNRFVENVGNSTTGGALVAANGTWTVTNNHFLGVAGAAAIQASGGSHLDAVNNLFLENEGFGISIAGGTLDSAEYNWFHANGGTISPAGLSATNTTFGDPDLVDWTPGSGHCSSDQLVPTPIDSPLLDAGDPALVDPDGSRSDIGAFGGPDADPRYHVDDDNDNASFLHDCDDTNPVSFPGNDEICDAFDNDCNGLVDDEPEDIDTFYPDCDGDGEGTTNGASTQCFEPDPLSCAGGEWISQNEVGSTAGLDCDDTDALVNTSADESCDDGDQNCDGDDDFGATDGNAFYLDGDIDGYGSILAPSCDFSPPPGSVELGGDCNDNDDDIHPGALDPCGDNIDNDCNGGDGDDTTIRDWYPDTDHDGYGETTDTPTVDCNDFGASGDYTTVDLALDCDDTSATVNPDAAEVCNGVDDDCNTLVDDVEGLSTWYEDQDRDTWGNSAFPVESACPPDAQWTAQGGDCDDGDDALSPGAPEICNDLDDDCDGKIDAADDNAQGVKDVWVDWDGDGYGSCAVGDDTCAPVSVCTDDLGDGYAPNPDDCNDADASQNPSRQEIPGNGLDENCDGDLGADGPGGGNEEDPGCNCATGPNPTGALSLLGLLLLSVRRRRS